MQIPFLISVFCWTGVRIGRFFPDKAEKRNGKLRYKIRTAKTRGLPIAKSRRRIWMHFRIASLFNFFGEASSPYRVNVDGGGFEGARRIVTPEGFTIAWTGGVYNLLKEEGKKGEGVFGYKAALDFRVKDIISRQVFTGALR